MSSDYTAPVIKIDTKRCILCGACADICLGNAIQIDEKRNAVYFESRNCIICENCHDFYFNEECPTGAFSAE